MVQAEPEGLPAAGRGSEVGKFWGSGEGAGGGLNFTLSDLQGDLEGVVKNWNFGLPGRGSEVGKFCSEYVQGPPGLRYPEPTPFEPSGKNTNLRYY